MTSLLTRLREATIGSAELDLVIAEATGKWATPLTDDDRAYLLRTDDDGVTEFHRCYDHGRWTSSLDDAVMLVPLDYLTGWQVSRTVAYKVACEARISLNGANKLYIATAATPPLALCIAALAARGIK